MNEQEFNTWLNERAREMPRSVEPQRDLWPQINARLSEEDRADRGAQREPRLSRLWPFAAGVAATALVAIMAIQIVRQGGETPPSVAPTMMAGDIPPPETLTVSSTWVPNMERASNELKADYEASLDNLSPETRAIVEENLAQIHDSLAKIHDALAQDPSNASLHRLLAGTYQQELSLFSSIGALNKAEVEL